MYRARASIIGFILKTDGTTSTNTPFLSSSLAVEGPTATTIANELSEFCRVSHNSCLFAKLNSPLTDGGTRKGYGIDIPEINIPH